MADQKEDATGESLNVFSATEAFEGLLSADEEYSEPDGKETPAKGAEEDEVLEGDEAAEVSPDGEETEQPPEEDVPADDETPEDEPEQPQTVTVTIDGKPVEVPLDEAIKGYSRTQDYTRKTQALAEDKKKFLAEREAVQGERQQYVTYLEQLKTALQPAKEPDWDKLREEAPEEFATAWADWQRSQKRVEAVEAEQRKTLEKYAQEQMVRLQETVAAERERLLDAIPEWKDSKVAEKEKAALVKYGTETFGFTEDELGQVVDHRAILALRKAMLYDQAQAKKAAAKPIIEKKTVVAKPGARSNRPATSELTRMKQRLAKTGSKQDAAAIFERIID